MTLTPADYLAHLRAEAALFVKAVVAVGYDAPVPTCPEWDLHELARHVGSCYRHKAAAVRLGRKPGEGDYARAPDPGVDVLDWLDDALNELVAEFGRRDPQAPCWTWQPADQTVAFWMRRMAQETLVHRLDAELAAEPVAGAPSPVDPELAADGVDEMLHVFLVGPWWREHPVDEASGRTVGVSAGGREWRVTLEPTAVTVHGADGPEPAAVVAAAPSDALMWVWGRPVTGDVTTTGDESAVRELRARLASVSD